MAPDVIRQFHEALQKSPRVLPGAIIGDGDRKRGVHAAPSKKTNVLFLEKNWASLNVINARGYTQICVQRGYDQDGYNYLISSMPEYIMDFIIKNAIANCYEIKKEKKKREKLRDKREQESIAIT